MNREALKSDAQTLAKGWLISEAAAYKRLGEGVLSLLAELDAAESEVAHLGYRVEAADNLTDKAVAYGEKVEAERDQLKQELRQTYMAWDETSADRDRLRELCHRAWALLEVVEPNDPITDELHNALRRTLGKEGS